MNCFECKKTIEDRGYNAEYYIVIGLGPTDHAARHERNPMLFFHMDCWRHISGKMYSEVFEKEMVRRQKETERKNNNLNEWPDIDIDWDEVYAGEPLGGIKSR